MPTSLSSAGGILALLEEPMPELKVFALKKLEGIVDEFWAEISESIGKIEILHEEEEFPQRSLAALIASKVYYHLGSYDDSLHYALGAGSLFDVHSRSQYVETTIAKIIDSYISKRNNEEKVNEAQEGVVNRMFERCLEDGEYKQALGIAIEARRLDVFQRAIKESNDENGMLSYAFRVSMTLIQNRTYRATLLRVLIDLYRAVAGVLETLSKGSSNDVMMAYQIAFDMYESATQQFLNAVVQAIQAVEEDTKMEESSKPEEDEQSSKSEKLISILSGKKTIYLHLQFLIRNDHSDLLILKQTKDAVRVSICHTATVIANGLMHCGTTHDSFLRDNLEWLSRATNWAKLSATASLGVIHRGHERDSLSLMQSYLPKDSANSSGYAEGGGLYALGLIHANHGGEITEYLLNQLKEGGFEQLRHGGCLGLGLAAMGTHRADPWDLFKLGSKDATAIEDMVAYAHGNSTRKNLERISCWNLFVMYGLLEEADPLIDSLCSDKDAILRRSGMYTIAMAYCGTGSNKAIRRLLHVAVSDVNDDVRRAAVMESYNPHVRYGAAAMALGIACAGTGSKEAIALIEPMTNDPVNYVRQGAWIASALILIQHTEFTCPKVKDFRALYAKVIGDKHEDVMAKFGAILAQGIIDGGGRNVTVSLQSRTGHTNMVAVVGMLVFTQYWYWFPLSHFLGLAFTPSCLIGLNNNLDMPVVTFKSNAKPSVYGYPAMLEEKKKEDKEKVATAVLSITHKQKRKDAEKRKKDVEKMEVDEKEPVVEKEKTEKKEEKRKDEPHFETLSNPARVMKQQLKLTHIEDPTKYKALKDTSIGGIIMMNNQTGEKDEIVEPVQVKKNHVDTANDGDEPEPPEPFEYIED
ncbi:PSMD1 [Lepeophtheirus salmonis]|uniref:26S proteasome non-ATPase regulatory subunit 1 n=1 Tax=Lepeophtheirus salmonis TaxID=72036 RepID=A0A7R8HAN6_LEPSM|nr:PSMD1 [Lepeophtheirus salmonis]CAF2959198.1 PSMD1 [Lepeophtheirus salmonis]